MGENFNTDAERAIPAEFHMISGSRDSQTSADVFDVDAFRLPDPAGKAGGACTSALIQVLEETRDQGLSWVDVLTRMRERLLSSGYDQIPQLTSSRQMSVQTRFDVVQGGGGTLRALIVGINYVGQDGELRGCHNDAKNIRNYLVNNYGYDSSNITMLLDDGYHTEPTYNNIMAALDNLTTQSMAGDSVFFHYSGHGGRVRDTSGDEDDGYDETLIPVDFNSTGQIKDDDLYRQFVTKMPSGVMVTCLMDCCHSGTVMDLPYRFRADGESEEMEQNPGFDMVQFVQAYAAMELACCCLEMLGGMLGSNGLNELLGFGGADGGSGFPGNRGVGDQENGDGDGGGYNTGDFGVGGDGGDFGDGDDAGDFGEDFGDDGE